jgi:hypothetical protein
MHILNTDFFISTMIDVMSPMELYHFRLTTKIIYKEISLKVIENKIISNVKNRLLYDLKDNYENFINYINTYHVTLYGPYITEVIWDEYHNTRIDIRILYDDNVKYIYGISEEQLKLLNMTVLYDSDMSFKIHDKIEMYVISDDSFDTYESYPLIFQNSICDWHIKIKDVKSVMYKKSANHNYYNSFWYNFEHKTVDDLYKKYNLV